MTKELHRLTKRLQFAFGITNKIYNLVAEIDSLNTQFRVSEKLSHQTIKRLTQSVLVTSSWASNRIEGNKLSDQEVEALYKSMNIKKFTTRDEQEVAWYLELLELVFDQYKDMKFNEWLILQIHDMLLKYTEKDQWHKGKYKFGYNTVEARDATGKVLKVIFNPTEPALVPHEMKTLIVRLEDELQKKEIHPLLVIANFIFEYLAIHPFQDGNGRTSRIITNLLLLQHWYFFVPFVSHEALIEVKKVDYYIALNKSQQTWKTNHEDMSAWILFFLEIIKQQVNNAIAISEKDNIEPHLSKLQNEVWNMIVTSWEISPKEIQEKTWISMSTIKQVLDKLMDMWKIERLWATRWVRYRLVK